MRAYRPPITANYLSTALRFLAASAVGQPALSPTTAGVVKAATEDVPIVSKNADRDRTGLVKILDDANGLLSVGKNVDAVQKLTDYIVKVEQLKAAGRIDAAAADGLIAAANDAIACINAIGV